MILYLNTSDLRKADFKLLDGKQIIAEYTADIAPHESHTVMQHLAKFLRKHNIISPDRKQRIKSTTKLTAVLLYSGPGSNTGLRIGAAIAQSLSFAWHIEFKQTKRKL